jgi:TM2 domain-containing membrane protein YozV
MAGELPLGARPLPPGGLSSEVRAVLLFEANKTEPLIGYVLLFTLGWLGAHNFYLQRTGIAITQLILTLTVIGLPVTMVWVVVDAFLIPSIIRRQNNALAQQLGA